MFREMHLPPVTLADHCRVCFSGCSVVWVARREVASKSRALSIKRGIYTAPKRKAAPRKVPPRNVAPHLRQDLCVSVSIAGSGGGFPSPSCAGISAAMSATVGGEPCPAKLKLSAREPAVSGRVNNVAPLLVACMKAFPSMSSTVARNRWEVTAALTSAG